MVSTVFVTGGWISSGVALVGEHVIFAVVSFGMAYFKGWCEGGRASTVVFSRGFRDAGVGHGKSVR